MRRLVLHVGQYHEYSETAPSEMDLLADVLSDVRPEALELTFVSHWRRLDRCSASLYGAIHKAQRKIHWVKATIVLHPLPCISIVRDAAGAVKRIMVSEYLRYVRIQTLSTSTDYRVGKRHMGPLVFQGRVRHADARRRRSRAPSCVGQGAVPGNLGCTLLGT